jgi:hypothetical protein
MDEHPSAGTRGDTLPDWLNKVVADSADEQARQNALPPDDAAAIAECVSVRNALVHELTADKRAMATPEFGPDLSAEYDTANRQAVTTVRQRVAWRAFVAAPRPAAAPVPVASTAVCSRERHDRAGRSSQKSGDSPSDSDGESDPPPHHWRWVQPAGWPHPTPTPHRYARRNRARQAVPA